MAWEHLGLCARPRNYEDQFDIACFISRKWPSASARPPTWCETFRLSRFRPSLRSCSPFGQYGTRAPKKAASPLSHDTRQLRAGSASRSLRARGGPRAGTTACAIAGRWRATLRPATPAGRRYERSLPSSQGQHGDRQVGTGPVLDSGDCPRDFERRQPFGQSGART
jgi:hypothetical protein